MKRTFRATTLLSMVLVFVASSRAQAARSNYDPGGNGQASKPHDSFIDFALKKINPTNKDYGDLISVCREQLLAETIQNGLFWSNVVALAVLGFLFILVMHQHKRHRRSACRWAEVAMQYEYALKRATQHVETGTTRNREIMQALLAVKESDLRQVPARAESNEFTAMRQPRARSGDAQPNTTEPPKSGATKPVKVTATAKTAASDGGVQIGLFKSDVDLVMKVNSLEQQLARSKDVESELRRQLNGIGRKLQSEQEKNRALKGG